ncbi:MAG: hypothetical protein ACK4Z5_07250 [Brevundimonas sp.]
MRAVTALAALMLAAAPAALAQSADPIQAAIADPRRPAEDVARDTARASAEMLAFAEIGPGDRVADIRPEEGFFARLFAVAVGPEGRSTPSCRPAPRRERTPTPTRSPRPTATWSG